jgi:hypothetical protein
VGFHGQSPRLEPNKRVDLELDPALVATLSLSLKWFFEATERA